MTIFLIGANHRTAPVELRECLHLSREKSVLLMEQLRSTAGLSECVVLSTCNRFEVYGVALDADRALCEVAQFIERENGLTERSLMEHLYASTGQAAVTHLMRVAAGLDSMVLGEAQILGQVGDANKLASMTHSSGTTLHRLFEAATHAGKRARTETAIGEHTTSISHAAVQLALSVIDRDQVKTALVIGAGKMASLAIDALRSKGIEPVDVVNRTEARAQELANVTGGRAYGWYSLHEAIANSDVVISATGAPHTVIHKPDMERVMCMRGARQQVLIDTAVPRDISADVEDVAGVAYFNIDDLQQVVDENHAKRAACIPAVEAILTEETDKFLAWMREREVVPAIKGLRRKVQEIATAELEQALRQIPDADHAVVEKLVHRIVNKVLHEPTMRLRRQATQASGEEYIYAVRDLFALDFEEMHG